MDTKSFFSRALPYVIALLCFAALSCFYFSPQFEGRALRMHDMVQYEGSAKDTEDHIAEYGEDPQWTGSSFSGMPTSLTSMRHPGAIVRKTFPVFEFMGRPGAFIFIAMAAFFVMLLMFGMNPWAAIVPALAYGLSTYFFIIIGAGHITKMAALAYAPLMVGGVYYTLRRNMWLGAALTAFFAALEIAANHPQITYYFVFVIGALWINELVRAVREKIMPAFWKRTGLLVIAAVMAVGANLSPLWYVAEYSQDSIRGGSELTADPGEPAREKGLDLEYATGWSYGIDETFNMYIPYLKGGSSEGNFSDDGPVATALSQYGAQRMATSLPSYFGTQPMTAGPTYVGAVAVFLAVLAMFMLRRRWTLWVALVSLLAITLSWGHNFMWLTKLFFYWFPGYNKFRVVAMILVIVEWSVPFLGALAIHKLWKSASPDEGVAVSGAKTSPAAKTTTKPDTERIYKGLKYSVAVLGALSLFFIVFGGSIFDFSSPSDVEILYSQARYGGLDDGQAMQFVNSVAPAMQTERAQMMRADAWRSLAFMVLAAGVVFAFARSKIRRGVMVALLAALVCVDMVVVNMRFLPKEKFVEERQSAFVPTQADLQILSDTEPGFRVLNLTVSPWNDATTSYFHRSLGGYHGAKMQRYQDVIDRYLGKMDMGVLNMLNTKYVIQRDQRTGEPVPAVNPDANGAAWFVETAISVANADEEIAMLGKIDNKREAVVDERFAHLLTATTTTADSTSYIRLTDYKPNHLTYEYDASDETYAVFSEIYYDKGWQAYIDGQPKEHFRVNYILRGMVLPAGRHTVEFRFRAENFSAVSNITLIFSLLIIVSLVAAIAAAALCNRRKDAGEQETAA